MRVDRGREGHAQDAVGQVEALPGDGEVGEPVLGPVDVRLQPVESGAVEDDEAVPSDVGHVDRNVLARVTDLHYRGYQLAFARPISGYIVRYDPLVKQLVVSQVEHQELGRADVLGVVQSRVQDPDSVASVDL